MDTMSRNMKWALLDTKIKVIWPGGEVSEKVHFFGRGIRGKQCVDKYIHAKVGGFILHNLYIFNMFFSDQMHLFQQVDYIVDP